MENQTRTETSFLVSSDELDETSFLVDELDSRVFSSPPRSTDETSFLV